MTSYQRIHASFDQRNRHEDLKKPHGRQSRRQQENKEMLSLVIMPIGTFSLMSIVVDGDNDIVKRLVVKDNSMD